MFIASVPSDNEKELTLSGIFYLLTRDDKGGWKIEKHKEIDPTKKLNKTDFDNVFPKVGTSIKENQNHKPDNDYWDFVSGSEDMDNACKKGDDSKCKGEPKTKSSFQGL